MKARFLTTSLVTLLLVLAAGCGSGSPAVTQPLPANTASAGGQPPTTVAAPAAAPTTPPAISSGNASSGASIDLTAFDVCGLLTKDEIVSLMPNVVYKHTASDFDPKSGTKTCTYADGTRTGYLQLTLYTPNRWDDEAKVIGDSPQAVAGLGDEAVTQALQYAQVLAVLVRGRAAFLLTVHPGFKADGGYDTKQASEIAMQLAMKIIPRLR